MTERSGTSVFLVTRVGPASQYNGCLFQEGIKHEAHCMPALASRDIEADPMVSLCQSHPINVHTQKRICKQTCLLSDALTLKWTHTPPAPPTYHLVWVFSVASYLLAGGSTLFFYCLLYHQRTRFHFFFFQSKIEILQAYLHVRPHTHVHTKDTHIHRDTQIHTPRGHAFFYFPVSNKKNKKKDWREKWKECWREGIGSGEICTAVCLRDSHHCQRERRVGRSRR